MREVKNHLRGHTVNTFAVFAGGIIATPEASRKNNLLQFAEYCLAERCVV